MRITNIPAEYDSAYGELLYRIAGDGTGEAAEVEILGGEGGVIGVKRFVDDGEFTVNAAPFVRALLQPEPGGASGVGFRRDSSKLVSAAVRAGGAVSEWRNFSAALCGIDPDAAMTVLPAARAISGDERDEISFAGAAARFEASVKAEGGASVVFPVAGYDFPGGVCTLCIDMTEIMAYAASKGIGPGDLTHVNVKVSRNGAVAAEYRYDLKAYQPDAVRLCWLNSLGGIDGFTFPVAVSSGPEVARKRIVTGEGHSAGFARVDRILEINSGCQPVEVLRGLSEIVYSPRVWRVSGGVYLPVDVISDNAVFGVQALASVTLRIRDRKPLTVKNA